MWLWSGTAAREGDWHWAAAVDVRLVGGRAGLGDFGYCSGAGVGAGAVGSCVWREEVKGKGG